MPTDEMYSKAYGANKLDTKQYSKHIATFCMLRSEYMEISSYLSAESIDQNSCNKGGDKVNHAQNNGTDAFVHIRTSINKNFLRIKYHSVYTAKLLEEHQTQRYGKWL